VTAEVLGKPVPAQSRFRYRREPRRRRETFAQKHDSIRWFDAPTPLLGSEVTNSAPPHFRRKNRATARRKMLREKRTTEATYTVPTKASIHFSGTGIRDWTALGQTPWSAEARALDRIEARFAHQWPDRHGPALLSSTRWSDGYLTGPEVWPHRPTDT